MSAGTHQDVKARIGALTARLANLNADRSLMPRQRHSDLEKAIVEMSALVADVRTDVDPDPDSSSQSQAEIMYRAIGDAVPDFVWSCSANGSPLYVNPRWTEYTGMGLFDHLPMNVLHHPDDYPHVVEKITESVANGGEKFEVEFRLRRKDGAYRWVVARVAPVKDELGAVVQWVGVSTDIHERKLAELAFNQNYDRLQQIVETAPDAVVSMNTEGIIIGWNGQAEIMFGWLKEEVSGRSLIDTIIPEANRKSYTECIGRFLESGDSPMFRQRIEVDALHRNGREFSAELSISPIQVGNTRTFSAFLRDLSERKQFENDLRSSNERFRATFEQAAVGFAQVSAKGRWLLANDKLCSTLGYPRDELLSLCFSDITCHDDDENWDPVFARLLTGEVENCKLELRCIRKDEQLIWVMVNASAIRGPKGDLNYISCVIQDITERKRAAYALTKSLRTLSTAEQIAGTGGWEFDVASETISRSDELSRIVGVPSGTDVTSIDRVLDLIHADDREMMADSLNSSIRDRKPYVCKYRIMRPDGREIVVSVRGEPIVDEFDRVVRVIGSTQDVTLSQEAGRVLEQRRRMALLSGDLGAALIRNHSLRKTLKLCTEAVNKHLQSAFTFIWIFNEDNSTFELMASSADSTLVDYDDTYIPSAAVECLSRVADERTPCVSNSLLNGSGQEGDEWTRRESIVAYAGLPLVVNKKLVGVLALFSRHAVTYINKEALYSAADAIALGIQRRKAEDELRKLNADLENVVSKRTAQLQAVHKQLDEFTYSVAHELRAPLRGIDGFSQLVISEFRSQLPEQARLYLNRVRNSAQRMQKLIDELLRLSYLGKQPLNMQQVDMNSLVEEVISELRSLHPSRAIEVHTANLPACKCDPYLIHQVFANLLSNSFKYTGRNALAEIEVGCTIEDDACVFFVRDNGVGFDMEHAAKLFEAFRRLHKAEDFDGAGIGLAIVQRIVSRHGGAVWAQSQPDKGAAYYFTLKEDTTDGQARNRDSTG